MTRQSKALSKIYSYQKNSPKDPEKKMTYLPLLQNFLHNYGKKLNKFNNWEALNALVV